MFALRRLMTSSTGSSPLGSIMNASSRRLATNVAAPVSGKTTVVDIKNMKKRGEKITMVTAYTYPSAVHVDSAGIDMILVGDSLAMVELGHDTTLPVTLDQMLYHCKAVSRGASRSLLVGDMPFGSYEVSDEVAYTNAIRFLKEGGCDAVKLEGGRQRASTIRTLVRGGVAVVGHVGLTPQAYSVLGGFRSQGRNLAAAVGVLEDALAVQEAGACAVVVECVPPEVGAAMSAELDIPVIGIGAGGGTDGQVLVYHDLLGMMEHEHYKQVTPRFCKRFAALGQEIHKALTDFKTEVREDTFPGPGKEFSPYTLAKGDVEAFAKVAEARRVRAQEQAKAEAEAEAEALYSGGGKK